ncbi:MAG: GIY-YIG nuclease family protein [Cyanophyceae cyanobacterium]
MVAQNASLSSLDYISYLNHNGLIAEKLQGKIGVYAIYSQDKILQYIGYSRDIYLSLKQHLVRQPESCYWLKVQTIERPNRIVLESMRQAWIAENGSIPSGNEEAEATWTEPIDAKPAMTEAEREEYEQGTELEQVKLLKKVARRVEEDIKQQLEKRGVKLEIRFNPKTKEQGLLDLK